MSDDILRSRWEEQRDLLRKAREVLYDVLDYSRVGYSEAVAYAAEQQERLRRLPICAHCVEGYLLSGDEQCGAHWLLDELDNLFEFEDEVEGGLAMIDTEPEDR